MTPRERKKNKQSFYNWYVHDTILNLNLRPHTVKQGSVCRRSEIWTQKKKFKSKDLSGKKKNQARVNVLAKKHLTGQAWAAEHFGVLDESVGHGSKHDACQRIHRAIDEGCYGPKDDQHDVPVVCILKLLPQVRKKQRKCCVFCVWLLINQWHSSASAVHRPVSSIHISFVGEQWLLWHVIFLHLQLAHRKCAFLQLEIWYLVFLLCRDCLHRDNSESWQPNGQKRP